MAVGVQYGACPMSDIERSRIAAESLRISDSPRADLENLRDLVSHPGWLVLMGAVDDNIQQATDYLVDPKRSGDKDYLNFQRGAIWAAQNLKGLAAKRAESLESQIAFEQTINEGAYDGPQ